MTTPGEIDRICRSLVRKIEEQAARITALEHQNENLQNMLDVQARKNLGFPPRRLQPDIKRDYIAEIENRD